MFSVRNEAEEYFTEGELVIVCKLGSLFHRAVDSSVALFICVWSVPLGAGLTQRCSTSHRKTLGSTASWWHQLLCCPSTVLIEEMSLDFTENRVLSYYLLPCQSRQVSLTAFSGAMNLGFPLLTHSGSTENMAAALASSHGPGRAPSVCFDCQGVSTTKAT